jgi:hypothetical protein
MVGKLFRDLHLHAAGLTFHFLSHSTNFVSI